MLRKLYSTEYFPAYDKSTYGRYRIINVYVLKKADRYQPKAAAPNY